MRTIKFRGKQTYGNKWVYGYLVVFGVENRIYYGPNEKRDYSVVNGKTVGQFTGIEDKDGNEIFEGDIISSNDHKHKAFYHSEENGYRFELIEKNPLQRYCTFSQDLINKYKKKVIGNIHENSELLTLNS